MNKRNPYSGLIDVKPSGLICNQEVSGSNPEGGFAAVEPNSRQSLRAESGVFGFSANAERTAGAA